MSEQANKFIKLRDVIIYFLYKQPDTRNCDKLLTLRVLQYYLNQDVNSSSVVLNVSNFDRIPPFESIKRQRALIQNNEKLYLPTKEEVRLQRQINQTVWLDYVRNYPDQQLPNIKPKELLW